MWVERMDGNFVDVGKVAGNDGLVIRYVGEDPNRVYHVAADSAGTNSTHYFKPPFDTREEAEAARTKLARLLGVYEL